MIYGHEALKFPTDYKSMQTLLYGRVWIGPDEVSSVFKRLPTEGERVRKVVETCHGR